MKWRFVIKFTLIILCVAVGAQENETEITAMTSSSEVLSDTTAKTVNRGIKIGKLWNILILVQGDDKKE